MVSKASYDALLNEYKGNVFEFLVGKELSTSLGLFDSYITETLNNSAQILEQQESFIRNYYPELLTLLPLWAKDLSDELIKSFKFKNASKVHLVGKQLAISNNDKFKEADLLIECDKKIEAISIKLAKSGSFVNTKSAGVKSIFNKYFSKVASLETQDVFNQRYDELFDEMAINMHQEAGVLYDKGFDCWESYGLATLPGKLEESYKKILYEFYSKVTDLVYDLLIEFSKKDPQEFLNSIWDLSGKADDEVIQVIAFHKQKSKNANKCDILISKRNDKVKLKSIEKKTNMIDVVCDSFKLQLRLKPMNKFTSRSYKINCAIKS